jgi:autotransporter-associated beta strand protein
MAVWVACGLAAPVSHAIVWNGNRPDLGVTDLDGLTDRPGLWQNVHVLFNDFDGARGTATYLANNWVLTARHVVELDFSTGLVPVNEVSFYIDGVDHWGVQYQELPSQPDMVLVKVDGAISLPSLPRSVIYDGSSDGGRLAQMGGYGIYGWFGQSLATDIKFHRGWNLSYDEAGGTRIRTDINGDQRLQDLGLLEVGGHDGDSGGPIFILDGADTQRDDWSKYKLAGVLSTSTGGGVLDFTTFVRTSPHAELIQLTVWGPPVVNYTFNKTTGDLAAAANWTSSQAGAVFPANAGHIIVSGGRTATFSASSNGGSALVLTGELRAGQDGVGIINITGGRLTAGNHLVAGGLAGGSGAIAVSGSATLTIHDSLRIGEAGQGTFTQTGGTINVNFGQAATGAENRVSIGMSASASGVYTISAGSINIKGDQADASNGDLPGGINVGDGGRGVLNLSGTGSVRTRTLYVGRTNGSAGAVRQAGGTMTVSTVDGAAATGENRIGGIAAGDTTAYGSYSISGGAFSAAIPLQVGAHGLGSMTVRGGTVTPSGTPSIGRFATGQGVLTVSAGRFARNTGSGVLAVGERGVGAVNVSGTGVLDAAGEVVLGREAGSTGTLNLNGGELRASRIYGGGANSTSRLNFDGGTIVATAASSSGLINGLRSALVYNSGATIDTNGFNVTIPQPLLAPTGNGLASISMTSGGSGFLGPPLVRITGGGGAGATAVADIDPATGAITGIQVTSPGVNYTSPPAIELLGGGGSGAAPGAVALSPNTSGGLTKQGAGTLTLTGLNTITGPTSVEAGTLVIGGAGGRTLRTSALSIAAGAKLDLATNELIIGSGDAALIAGHVGAGRLIASTPSPLIALLATANDRGNGAPLLTSLSGVSVSPSDILVTRAYFGDADLSGDVNLPDYFRIDAGRAFRRTGWTNGDFDHSGGWADAADYMLIDRSFLAQGSPLPLAAAAVPDPACTVIMPLAAALLARRRRVSLNAR